VEIFLPDIFIENVYKIDIQMLKENNIKGLILDVDNTLVKHFIYAKENSPAGNRLNSIKSIYRISTSKYTYDYKETIIEHFKYMSLKMFDVNGNV